MERQLNIELQAMNETLMAQIADHRCEVDAIKADALDVSNQQRKQVADLRGQLEAERGVQQALTDIIAEERAKLEAAAVEAGEWQIQQAHNNDLRGTIKLLEIQVAQLTTLRGLVEALPVVEYISPKYIVAYVYVGRQQLGLVESVEALLRYRATLAQAQPKGEQ